jgi:hypothetical protein
MLREEWCLGTTSVEASHEKRVICVLLPFLDVPGIMGKIFSRASCTFVSLVPRPLTISPTFSSQKDQCHSIPFLPLHLLLVEAYWSTRSAWKAWSSLENEFDLLWHYGLGFHRGSIQEYSDVVKAAASQFVSFVEEAALRCNATAVALYGRGHWMMNAAAVAAQRLGLKLYVIERGLLSNSYIVDRALPFTATGSTFRSAWNSYHQVEDWQRPDLKHVTESRWNLYASKLEQNKPPHPVHGDRKTLLVGQCLFDYNSLNAPYTSAAEFIDYALTNSPDIDRHNVLYKPHPLSPEEYPDARISTLSGPIAVDSSDAWAHLRNGATVHTWNSTLGLEAFLLFNRKVVTLDPHCHYAWIQSCNEPQKQMYIAFLNDISVAHGV